MKENHEQIIQGLLALKKIFNKHNIFFWLEGGTLLGAMREGKIIPWDGDADVSTDLSDVIKIAQTQKDFQKIGYELIIQNGHYVLRNAKTKKQLIDIISTKEINNFCVKLSFTRPFRYFTWMLSEPDYTTLDYKIFDYDKKFFPKFIVKLLIDFCCKLNPEKRRRLLFFVWRLIIKFNLYIDEAIYAPMDYLGNFTTVNFYGETFFIPEYPDKYLTNMYGNWRVPDKNYVYHKIRLKDVKKN